MKSLGWLSCGESQILDLFQSALLKIYTNEFIPKLKIFHGLL